MRFVFLIIPASIESVASARMSECGGRRREWKRRVHEMRVIMYRPGESVWKECVELNFNFVVRYRIRGAENVC